MNARLETLDAKHLVELAELFEEAIPGAFDRAGLAAHLGSPGTAAWGLIGADRLVAGILVRRVLDEAEVLMLASRARRAGHAFRLLEHAWRRLETEGVERIFLEVAEDNIPARALYAKAGFQPIGRRSAYYRSGADALLLERRRH